MKAIKHKEVSKQVSFPAIEVWNEVREVVSFPAEKNQTFIVCAISWETLQENFKGTATTPIDRFRANRIGIQSRAETLIKLGHFEPNGTILIRPFDANAVVSSVK